MQLYVVRHGETDWNKQKKFQGRVDIELNENGRNAAINLGKNLSLKSISFDYVFSSPLKRAYETAFLILKNLYSQMDETLIQSKIIKDEKIIEITFGILEGMTYKDWMNTTDPRKNFFDNPKDYLPPQCGETFSQVCERTKEFVKTKIETIYKENPNAKVLLVSHGASLAALMCYLENRTVENYWGNGLKKNCEETIYEFNGKSWKLI